MEKLRLQRSKTVSETPDAILTHGYWLSDRKPGSGFGTGLSLRSRLAVRATALGYKSYQNGFDQEKDKKPKVFLAAGEIWGENEPSVGELMKDELINKFHVPEGNIIVRDEAVGTSGEIDLFLEEAKKQGWTNVVDIAAKRHGWSLPIIWRRSLKKVSTKEEINVTRKSAEEIIKEKDTNRWAKKLVDKFSHSKYERRYKFYQAVSIGVLLIASDRLAKKVKNVRDKKVHFSLGFWPFKKSLIDKYKILESQSNPQKVSQSC
ncbi:MAG: hypothetical protein M1365_04950 [Actinobacteria bacterium]|nr:hypothetical protein [Actinomycetota bacterium]